MVTLKYMSVNIVNILNRILKSQNIMKYLKYNVKNPLSQPNLSLPYSSGMMNQVFPYPFDETAIIEDCVQLRVWYRKSNLENKHVVEPYIYFDIINAKSLWLVNDGQSLVRPYEIMRLIIEEFGDKSIDTLGKLDFVGFEHLMVNEKFHSIRLVAMAMEVG